MWNVKSNLISPKPCFLLLLLLQCRLLTHTLTHSLTHFLIVYIKWRKWNDPSQQIAHHGVVYGPQLEQVCACVLVCLCSKCIKIIH
jgi:hypothetical protein